MKSMKFNNAWIAAVVLAACLASTNVMAQVESSAERNVYFGTTHGHSSWSIDAFALGNQKYGPEDGYRFALVPKKKD